jgi:hypothetical protein
MTDPVIPLTLTAYLAGLASGILIGGWVVLTRAAKWTDGRILAPHRLALIRRRLRINARGRADDRHGKPSD